MKIKTKGKCSKCNETYSPAKGTAHLVSCVLQSFQSSQSSTEGYLLRISWAEQPNLYWMFVTIPRNASLSLLDAFLRDVWLECCGHLSQFTIGGRRYMSHTESGNPSQSMKNQMGQVLSAGMKFEYVYDMGSSTDLEIEVVETVAACPQKKVTILMQNEPPAFPCESCKKAAEIICSLCGETTCSTCSEDHSCVINEGDTYMLMSLANSPRAGVCGYEGK
ncbi:MAG TPA: hypothetical protein VGO47_01680 [Chlamydiales bacterium]|jgi:hypothetical protein|nr:hypothetical protein [Chlamydiales bacterium]